MHAKEKMEEKARSNLEQSTSLVVVVETRVVLVEEFEDDFNIFMGTTRSHCLSSQKAVQKAMVVRHRFVASSWNS